MHKKEGVSFRNSLVYVLLQKVRRLIGEVKKESRDRRSPERRVITLSPNGSSRGRVLFSFIIDGFFLESDQPIPKTHTNIWQSLKMAETFVDLGFHVDVISYTNTRFVPNDDYAFFVDVRRNMERLSDLLNKDCVKIMHLDTAHILFHNAAHSRRLLELQNRRGFTLQHRRFEMPNLGIEHANYATVTGNDFVLSTFAYAKKHTFTLPSPCGITPDWPDKDWNCCRKKFLWFSSSGMVHKGLDLALDVFKDMPEYQLIVCAPVTREPDFAKAYHKELYETPNIQTIGWVDIESDKFKKITDSCVAALHLSCSEGGAPSVKMCMLAGLIPIVSYESGVDVGNFGFSLTDCSIDNIKKVIKRVADTSMEELKQRAHETWTVAGRTYTRENFSDTYRKVILEILEMENAKKHRKVSSQH